MFIGKGSLFIVIYSLWIVIVWINKIINKIDFVDKYIIIFMINKIEKNN